MTLPAPHDLPPVQPRLAEAAELRTTGRVETREFGARSVFLRPGDWLWGRAPVRASTLLGSCVAVVVWVPRLRIGAMCHCLLPRRPEGTAGAGRPAGCYGDEASAWIEDQFAGVSPFAWREAEVTLAGGARATDGPPTGVGEANLRWAQQWIAARGMRLVQADVGGRVVRRVDFSLVDGSVTVVHGGVVPAAEL